MEKQGIDGIKSNRCNGKDGNPKRTERLYWKLVPILGVQNIRGEWPSKTLPSKKEKVKSKCDEERRCTKNLSMLHLFFSTIEKTLY
jgi:hypothetical protein